VKKERKSSKANKSRKPPTARDVPKGAGDFLGDELHLFVREDTGLVLPQGSSRLESKEKK
jgi:hypothetical protein